MSSEDLTKSKSQDSDVVSFVPDDPAAAEAQRKGKISASQMWVILFAGVALMSDGYQNNIFNITSTLFGRIHSVAYTSDVKTRIPNALIVGAIIGQLSFGYVVDRYGRKIGLLLTTLLIVLGTILCATVYPVDGDPGGLFWALTITRGITGVGVGGEYPCSSAAASEASDETKPTRRGGVFILVTNLVLSLGGLLATMVYLVLFAAAAPNEQNDDLNKIWRIAFGVGALLPLSVFWFRFRMAHSERFNKNYSRTQPPYLLAIKKYWVRLVGTAGCWFLYDFVVFPNGIISNSIIAGIVKPGPHQLRESAEWTLLLNSLSIPGILAGAFLVDRIGRKNTMTLGFALAGIMGFVIAGNYANLEHKTGLFVLLYGLFLSFSNMGPGNCLGLTSAELYPTPLRGTFYGFSAAVGKAGAAIGNQILIPLETHYGPSSDPIATLKGNRLVFYICASVAFAGALLCWVCIPDFSGQTLEKEDREWREYMEANGFVGEFGFEHDKKADEGREDELKVGDFAPAVVAN
ncbi:major facilitator superfamily domain-containing protein [Blyttiomyces helicus]|uniref:Major facilitator superfamily domain-containing protein n=1 Tax=Blyttiomyces helicus TaxID=388810 RepID=A0A4P9W539_9FUNG|nr:major facilitator superfamily domain-containing protein [Blyttiomyces helicus]|eukprot:RKO87499.1 major facilitator superfamily domain-containing protein [Blyttiomyces helicus]